MLTNNNRSSIGYFCKVCRDHPLLVISTPHGIGKYHFSSIGFRQNRMLIEFNLIMDNDYIDSQFIQDNIEFFFAVMPIKAILFLFAYEAIGLSSSLSPELLIIIKISFFLLLPRSP